MLARLPASGAWIVLAAAACGGADPSAGRGAYRVSVSVNGPGRLLSLPPGIDCPGTCAAAFASGSWVTLAATSGDDVSFVEWSRGCSGASGCGFTASNDVEVTARFERTEVVQKK